MCLQWYFFKLLIVQQEKYLYYNKTDVIYDYYYYFMVKKKQYMFIVVVLYGAKERIYVYSRTTIEPHPSMHSNGTVTTNKINWNMNSYRQS